MNKKNLPLYVKIVRYAAICFLDTLFLPIYHLCGLFRRNRNLWIFSSWLGQKYNDSSRIFFEYMHKNHLEIRCVWLSKNRRILKMLRENGYEAVSVFSPYAMWLSFRAGMIFSTSSNEFFLGLAKGSVFMELWHGMPLKKIGFDDNVSKGNGTCLHKFGLEMNKRFFRWKSFMYMKNCWTLTSSDFFVKFLQTAFDLPTERILPVGLPRTDALFSCKKESLVEKVRIEFPGCKIVLYMPTFRTGVWSGKPFNPFAADYGFNADEFSDFLEKENIVLLYKPHFVDLELGQNLSSEKRFIFIDDESYSELYNFAGQVDMLMTDYSSIYFDFIATKKPVVLLPFDLDEYLKTSRAHYFEYSEIEGAKAKNWQEFYRILEEKKYSSVSEETRKKFAEYLDGKCCERLWEKIMELSR